MRKPSKPPGRLATSVFDLDPRRPEAQAMAGTDPYISESLKDSEGDTAESPDLSPPSAPAAPAS
jgi:hypothetical protein